MTDLEKNIEERFEVIRRDNPDKVVHPDIIKRLADCKLSNANKNINEWLNEAYLEYIDSLESLDEALLKRYLKVLKNADVKDNQSFEKVDSFLLSLYLESIVSPIL